MKNKKIKLVISFIAMLLFYVQNLYCQVTADPVLPTADSPVAVYFDATETNLEGYSGTLYAHTGLIIEGSSSWQHVIGNWGNNENQPSLTRLGENLYKLEINPSIKEFYSAGSSAVINQMAFVFRAASGSPQSVDLFVNVVQQGLVVLVTSPTDSQQVFEIGDIVNIGGAANEANSISLFINDEFIISTTENTISYDWLAEETGSFHINLIAESDEDNAEADAYIFVRPEVPIEELPDGVLAGANYIDDNTVTLVLHDPPGLKDFVLVIGDFNDWSVNEDYYMNRTPDGNYHWVTITGLTPDIEYGYQYYIDSELRLADPYTHKVLDPWNDKWIPSYNYPDLKEYPSEKTTGLVSIIHPGKPEFEWEVNDFSPPAAEDMVIYELLVRDFVETSSIKTVMDSLDYLQNLGVNVIELMPVNQFEGNISWGYNPALYFATDKAYGTMDDYKRFIDECHKRGIAVVIDIVLNHSFNLSPLVQMYFDKDAGSWGKPSPDNPWYLADCPHEPWCWGNTFDQDSPYAHEFFNRVVEYWLTEFKVDGFRFDFTKGFTNVQTGNMGSNYDHARVSNLKRIYNHVKSVNPDAYVILEHFADNSEEKDLAEYGMLLWGNITYNYQEASMGWIATSDFGWISHKTRGWSVPHLVGYMESHDEERMMFKNLTYGNSANPEHDVKDLNVGLRRAELAAAFYFPVPGPKMIWQFGELGYDFSINHCQNGTIDDGCRTDPKPIRWDYYDDWRRKRLYYVYSALANLKISHDVFRTNDFSLSLSGSMKRIHLDNAGEHVAVLGNFGVNGGMINPNFQKTGLWHEFFTEEEMEVNDVNAEIYLEPGEYRLYSSFKLPSHGLPLSSYSIEKKPGKINVYPNPSNDFFKFEIFSDTQNMVELKVFNISGQKVYSSFKETKPGLSTFIWNISNKDGYVAKEGVYIYRISSDDKVYTGKLVVK